MELWKILKNVNAPENETESATTSVSEPVVDENKTTHDTRVVVQETKAAVEEAVEKFGTAVQSSMSSFSDKLASFEAMMKSIPAQNAPEWYDDITIDEVERDKIMTYFERIKNEYFSDFEVNLDMPGEFIWCMPRLLYKTFDDMDLRMEKDILNPMFWFFMSCLKIDEEIVAKFLKIALDMVTPDVIIRIDELLGIEDETSDDETDGIDYVPSDIYDDGEDASDSEEMDCPPMIEETSDFSPEEADPEDIDIKSIAEASTSEETTKEENKNE